MYKYIEFIGIMLWTVFRKVFGMIWYWFVVWFRRPARSIVYNYILQNRLYLARLGERNPTWDEARNGWTLEGKKKHTSREGFIAYRKVNRLQYLLWYWVVWGWLDDDSTNDTYCSKKFFRDYKGVTGDSWIDNIPVTSDNGNSFDLGDKLEPCFSFRPAFWWTLRNTAYNFKYVQFETNKPRSEWFWLDVSALGGTGFGNRPKDGRLEFGWF